MNNEISIGFGRANVLISVISFLLVAPFIVLFETIWSMEQLKSGWDSLFGPFLFPILLLLIVTHELIHGIMFAVYNPMGFKSIRIGLKWKSLIAYCTCSQPIRIAHYRWVIGMPLIILGLIPLFAGLALGNGFVYTIGFLMSVAALGDVIQLIMLRNTSSHKYALDYSHKLGCQILESPKITPVTE